MGQPTDALSEALFEIFNTAQSLEGQSRYYDNLSFETKRRYTMSRENKQDLTTTLDEISHAIELARSAVAAIPLRREMADEAPERPLLPHR